MDDFTREFLRRRLRVIEGEKWISALIWDWLLAVGALALVGQALALASPWKWAWLVPAMLLLGACQHRLALLGHEAAHHLALPDRWWNDALGSVCCLWPLGISLPGYWAFHARHHATFGTAEDPERFHTQHPLLGQWPLPVKPVALAACLIGDLVGGAVPHVGMAAYLTRPKRFRSMLGPLGLMAAAFALGWRAGAIWIPLVWYASVWSAFFVWFRTRIYLEHIVFEGEDPTLRIDLGQWWAWPIRFAITPHNAHLHWEHHADMCVPFYHLPSLRLLTCEDAPIKTPAELVRHHTRAS